MSNYQLSYSQRFLLDTSPLESFKTFGITLANYTSYDLKNKLLTLNLEENIELLGFKLFDTDYTYPVLEKTSCKIEINEWFDADFYSNETSRFIITNNLHKRNSSIE